MRNIRKYLLFLIILVTLAANITTVESKPVSAQESPGLQTSAARLLSESAEGLSFEVFVPWEEVQLESVNIDDHVFLQVSLPRWSSIAQSGLPMLPVAIEMIGVPFGVDLEIQVKPGKAHAISLSNQVLPVPTQKVDWLLSEDDSTWQQPEPFLVYEMDPGIYATPGLFPGDLAVISNDGVIRQQRVVSITSHPVQYNPQEGTLVVYESLQIDVVFKGILPSTARQIQQDSQAYEGLFSDALLNYQSARAWRGDNEEIAIQAVEGTREVMPWLPPNPGWRVNVLQDGFYQLGYADLMAVGVDWPASVSSSTIQLFNMGQEVAIHVEDGGDGLFDSPTDYILFYGQSLSSKYTSDNVYWLSYDADGLVEGLRIDAYRDGTPGGVAPVEYYSIQMLFEYNDLYLQNAPYGPNLDQWMKVIYSPVANPASWEQTFSINEPYLGTGSLRLSMLGYVNFPAINPDHHVTVYLNDTYLGEVWWDGIDWHEAVMPINENILQGGENSLKLALPVDTGADFDRVAFDWIELSYPNTFQADGDQLPFRFENPTTGSQSYTFQISGFSTPDIAVYDVSDPWSAVSIINPSIELSGDDYIVRFQDVIPATSAAEYWVIGSTAQKPVQAITKVQASNLPVMAAGADHIVISHGDFVTQAQRLSILRNGQGLSSVTVDVQDVYDQFNFGIIDPLAIRNFLAYAYNGWGASYVVLVGDGHYNPKAYNFDEKKSYIPPYLANADPWQGETAADNRYVTLVGTDAMPDMMLGRLAVNTLAEAKNFIDKIIAYESQSGDWQREVLAVADKQGSSDPPFNTISDALLNDYFPSSFESEAVYLGITHPTGTLAREGIKDSINHGKLFVNYIGHGNVSLWSGEQIFRNADVVDLTNNGKLPIFLTMTCNNGYYLHPRLGVQYNALAEVLTNIADKGAVASWSPTGFGLTSGHNYLIRGFYQAVFNNGVERIGQATMQGKLNLWATSSNLDLLDTFLLFGDPALRLQTPTSELPAPTNLTANPISPSQVDLYWTDNAADESAYYIERSLTGAGGWTQIAEVGANIMDYSDMGLNDDTTYYYRVRAYRAGDGLYSQYSNIAHATTGNVPALPTNLSAQAISSTRIDLSWTDNAADETAYHIERSLDGSTDWQEIIVLPADRISYSDTGLTPGTTYFYRVRAYRASDGLYSGYTKVASATTIGRFQFFLPLISH